MGKTAFIYPGQGAQCIGMGKEFYEQCASSREVLDEGSDLLGIDLKKLCFEENDLLNRTDYTQIGLVAVCTAMTKEVISQGILPDVTAGLSLGEYSAIYAAGGMNLTDTLETIRDRGVLMDQAVPEGFGGMRAVMGLSGEEVKEVMDQVEDAYVANYNSPGQTVITGKLDALDVAEEKLKEAGARRITPLKISGPFHSPFIREAGEELGNRLQQVNWNDLDIPYVANVNAQLVTDIAQTPELLVDQVSSNVMWEQSVRAMADYGVDHFIEIGPGKTASKLVRKILPDAKVYNISVPEDVARCQEWLRQE